MHSDQLYYTVVNGSERICYGLYFKDVDVCYRPKPTEQHENKSILCILGIDKLTIIVRLSNGISGCHRHLN